MVYGALRAAVRSSINDKGSWETCATISGAKSLSQQTWLWAEVALQSPHPPAFLCLRTHYPPSLRAQASVAALGGFATVPALVECLWQVASRHGHSLLAPPEGHLLLNFAIARAYGLRPPSRIWWKPKRPPEVMKSFRAGEWQKKRAVFQEN